jgi:hypothetical protein
MRTTRLLALPLAITVAASLTLTAAAQERKGTGRGGPGPVVGTPGMFFGTDTGVTRGPVGSSNGTTGTYGAGSTSSGVVSSSDDSSNGTGSKAARPDDVRGASGPPTR